MVWHFIRHQLMAADPRTLRAAAVFCAAPDAATAKADICKRSAGIETEAQTVCCCPQRAATARHRTPQLGSVARLTLGMKCRPAGDSCIHYAEDSSRRTRYQRAPRRAAQHMADIFVLGALHFLLWSLRSPVNPMYCITMTLQEPASLLARPWDE